MMKAWTSRWIALPAQLLTGIVGFWLRGRWADAAGFALILLLLAIIYQVFLWVVWHWLVPVGSIAQDVGWYGPANACYLLAVLAINLGAVWCLRSGRSLFGRGFDIHPWLVVILGGLVLYVGHLLLTRAWYATMPWFDQVEVTLDHAAVQNLHQDRFNEAVRFGPPSTGHGPYIKRLVLPAGTAHIRGHIEFAGGPVKIYLQAELGERFKTQFVQTDAGNDFDIPVPPGKYSLRAIRAAWWVGKPTGSYFLTPLDRNLPMGGAYSRHRPALELNIPPSGVARVSPLIILPHIRLSLPAPSRKKDDDWVLRWGVVPGAAHYRVELVESFKNFEDSATLVCRDVILPELPVAALIVPAATGETYEYTVNVEAYAGDGTLLNVNGVVEATGGGDRMPFFSLPAGSRLAALKLPAGEWSCPDH